MQVDVFTATPYLGNPLAVVLDGEGLSEADMARFARWTNLSETTFVLPPTPEGAAAGADYRVRIFTPGGELPFAGHPTLGTCHAWRALGGTARQPNLVVQECGVGLVRIRLSGNKPAFAAPALQRSNPTDAELQAACTALGLTHQQVLAAQKLDNGPVWLGLLLDHPDTVTALQPDHAQLARNGLKLGVAAIHSPAAASGRHTIGEGDAANDDGITLIRRGSREARAFATGQRIQPTAVLPPVPDHQLLVRAFAAPIGVNEDPVTGSLNASLAQWLMADGWLPDAYVAAQGQALGRDGRVSLHRDAQAQVWVGGDVADCIRGTVLL
jgi:predicted PhzF superfamily epimerase YddE/YHI9